MSESHLLLEQIQWEGFFTHHFGGGVYSPSPPEARNFVDRTAMRRASRKFHLSVFCLLELDIE